MLLKYSQLVEEGQSCSRDPPVVPALESLKSLKQSLVFPSPKLGLCRAEPQVLLCSSNHVQNTLSPAYFQIFLLDRVVSSMIYYRLPQSDFMGQTKNTRLSLWISELGQCWFMPVLTRSLREQFHYQQPMAGRGVLGNGVPRKSSEDLHKTHSCL